MDKREKTQADKLRELVERGEVKHIPGHGVKVSEQAEKEWKQLNEVELTALKKFRDAQGFKPDEMHDISNKMIKRQKEVAYKQDEYGINKYNVPLRASHNYDWLKMATEELVDLSKYLECEMERKEAIKALLEYAISMEDWKFIELALFEINKDGTGK
jgi:hypothetical protein